MASSSKAPKHDFAPAWLKIPDQDNQKPPGSKSAEYADKRRPPSRTDEYYAAYNGYGAPPDCMYGPLQRQRSFDQYYEDRHYPPPKFRHHSVEDEYYSAYGYYNGYEKYGAHHRSQPQLFRDPGKYQHPNTTTTSRYNQPNGGPYPYYDPYFCDFYPGHPPTDPYYNNSYMRSGGGGSGGPKRYHSGDKDSGGGPRSPLVKPEKGDRTGAKAESDPGAGAAKAGEAAHDEEFPSLIGDPDTPDAKAAKPVTGSTVWDKQHTAKLVLNNNQTNCQPDDASPSGSVSDGQSSKEIARQQQNSNIYKALVPNKANLSRKTGKDSGKLGSKESPQKNTKPHPFNNSNKENSKEPVCQSPTPPIEIFNTRMVTQPKGGSNKKGTFLKALRKENGTGDCTGQGKEPQTNGPLTNGPLTNGPLTNGPLTNGPLTNGRLDMEEAGQTGLSWKNVGGDECSSDEPIVNGVDDLSINSHNGHTFLSSSLEAEQRLLREMGWNEADEEEYVITEDEKREFAKLKQLKEQRNGFKRPLPVVWSPQHGPSVFPVPSSPALNDTLSSTSDESDLE